MLKKNTYVGDIGILKKHPKVICGGGILYLAKQNYLLKLQVSQGKRF